MPGRFWLSAGAMLGVAVLLGALTFVPRSAFADDAGAASSCGTTDKPCPLQKWMRTNMGTPLANGDIDTVGRALARVIALSPDPSWAGWVEAVNAGAAASKNKDIAGLKASCKSCHDAYKEKYKSLYRARAVD